LQPGIFSDIFVSMTKTQIIGAIRLMTGKPVADVAVENGYSKHTFYRVIKGERNIPEVREIISSIVHKSANEIWPERPAGEE